MPDPATSFGAVAGVYERARPGYPVAAVRELLGAGPLDVLDLGAGTGKLTRVVAGLGHRVRAVDPDAAMLAELARAVPDVGCEVGSAEALPMADGSVDAVVAGQAYHWFDPERALPEIARVLRPGGRLGLLWNLRDDRMPWMARFGELAGAADTGDQLDPPAVRPLFGEASVRWYHHTTSLSVDGLVDLAASRSYVLVRPDVERAALLDEVRALAEQIAVDGAIRVPYRLQVWSAQKA